MNTSFALLKGFTLAGAPKQRLPEFRGLLGEVNGWTGRLLAFDLICLAIPFQERLALRPVRPVEVGCAGPPSFARPFVRRLD